MAKILKTYLYEHYVGDLIQNDHGQLVFQYDKSWLNNPDARLLSHSLPLRDEKFTSKECRGFFSGILPEQDKRAILARNLGISPRNDFSLLEKIGGECAGAITFLSKGTPPSPSEYEFKPLSTKELGDLILQLPTKPLLAGSEDIRLSLAGVQDKFALTLQNNKMSIPINGAPSTHILKIENHFPGLVHNEALCLALAKAIGLNVASASIGNTIGKEYLLIERYDRVFNNAGKIIRLHQEDFCQALSMPPETKYQSDGGPSLKDCFKLIREISSAPVLDLRALLDGVLFNFIIGNHDAHSKNFSLLYTSNEIKLAPLYDLVCTLYYPELSKKMAMKIGTEYNSIKVQKKHFEKFAIDAGLSKAMVLKRLSEMAILIISQLDKITPHDLVSQKVGEIILDRAKRYQKWS